MFRGRAAVSAFAVLVSSFSIAMPAAPAAAASGTTVYLPNITKMLGGADGWQTPFIVQNIGSTPTDLSIAFYAFSDGTLVKTRTISALAPGTSVAHDPNGDSGLAPGGQFSVVITSTASPVVAVVNEHQNVKNAARQEALSYSGLSSGSTRLAAPYVAKRVGGWLTTLIIQNLGGLSAQVTAQFISFDNLKNVTLTRTISPGRSQFVDPSVEDSLPDGIEYSVSLSSDQPIGLVANNHNDAASVQFPRGFSYNGAAATSETLTYLPYVAKNTDNILRITRVVVQNTGILAATPTLFIRRFDTSAVNTASAPQPLAPGQSWSFDPRDYPDLPDGDYSIRVTGPGGFAGRFAAVAATFSRETAMAYSGVATTAPKIYLPNVTRTLGGTNGWTTPIIIQSVVTQSVNLKWYRFADGALVTTQLINSLAAGVSTRVDPRTVQGLDDDTQYSVVVEASGKVAVIVNELNLLGGDGAMQYEGFGVDDTPATSGCSPLTAAAGSLFLCRWVGLTPNVPFTVTVTNATTGSKSTANPTQPTGADGTARYDFTYSGVGNLTATATAGTSTASATFTTTAATFSTQITQSTNGSIQATTKAGASCAASYKTSTGTETILPTRAADAQGVVSWTYAPLTTPTGQGTHLVICAVGGETHSSTATFNVP